MSGVMWRCRTCGTVQGHAGDCDACAAGPVAYFCGNHSPGLWLDGPVCSSCGARHGEARTAPAAPASRTLPSIPRAATRSTATTTRAERTTGTAGPPMPLPPGRVSHPDREPDTTTLSELLVEMAEEGRRAREAMPHVPHGRSVPVAPPIGRPILGCLFRVLVLLVLLGLLAVAAVFMLVNGAF